MLLYRQKNQQNNNTFLHLAVLCHHLQKPHLTPLWSHFYLSIQYLALSNSFPWNSPGLRELEGDAQRHSSSNGLLLGLMGLPVPIPHLFQPTFHFIPHCDRKSCTSWWVKLSSNFWEDFSRWCTFGKQRYTTSAPQKIADWEARCEQIWLLDLILSEKNDSDATWNQLMQIDYEYLVPIPIPIPIEWSSCLLKQCQAVSLSNTGAPAIPPWSFALGSFPDYRETSRNAVHFTIQNIFCNIINHHHIVKYYDRYSVISLHNVSFVTWEGAPQSYPVGYVMSKWHWIETQHRQRHNAHCASHPIAIDLAGDHWSHWWEDVDTPKRSKIKGFIFKFNFNFTIARAFNLNFVDSVWFCWSFFKVTSLDIDIDCKHLWMAISVKTGNQRTLAMLCMDISSG